MKLNIEINSPKKFLLIELEDILFCIKEELKSPTCLGCKDCKDKRSGCFVGGGSSIGKLESEWKLHRNYNEHRLICKSKNKK